MNEEQEFELRLLVINEVRNLVLMCPRRADGNICVYDLLEAIKQESQDYIETLNQIREDRK